MPTYQYACTECGERLEVVQKFSDDALTVCPVCAGRLRKVFSAATIVFKGSGFYRNDSRSGSGGKSAVSSDTAGKNSADPPKNGSGADKPASTPSDKPFGQSSGSGKSGSSGESAGGSKSGGSSGSSGSGSGGSGSGSKTSSGSKVA